MFDISLREVAILMLLFVLSLIWVAIAARVGGYMFFKSFFQIANEEANDEVEES